jgi:Tol biopolymer transport system component
MRRSGKAAVMAAAGVVATAFVGAHADASPAAAPTTVRVSVSSSGAQANAAVRLNAISDDGRYVLVTSKASNLVPGDTNGVADVFLRDTVRNRTIRVSVSSSGHQANGLSWANAVSGDGRFVLFTSIASNLSIAKDTNKYTDTFLRDRTLGITRRVGVTSSGRQLRYGSEGVAVSADGRYVLFNGSGVFVRDRVGQTTTRIAENGGGWSVSGCGLSPDARLVALEMAPYRYGSVELSIIDRVTHHHVMGDTETMGGVSFTPTGSEAAFTARATVVVQQPVDQVITEIDEAQEPRLTADGGAVSFIGWGQGLVPDDTNNHADLFVRDIATGATVRLDLTTTGDQIIEGVRDGAISSDGRWAAFSSQGTEIVPDDTNRTVDVFLRGPLN